MTTIDAEMTPTFETIREARFGWKDGHDIVVALRRTPAGHAGIDVREHITPEAYPTDVMTGSSRKPRRNGKVRGTDGAYVGPTRNGLWFANPGQLLDIADSIARMALELEAIQRPSSRRANPAGARSVGGVSHVRRNGNG
jgi:hypothetical protein